MQKHSFRVYFQTWKICAYGVFWKSTKDDIQHEIQVPSPVDAVLQNNFSVAINNLKQKICDNHSLT